MRVAASLLIAGALAAAGCSRKDPESATNPELNTVEAEPEPTQPMTLPEEAPAPPPAPASNVAVPPAETNTVALSEPEESEADIQAELDAQTIDDADASGMTTRAARNDDGDDHGGGHDGNQD